MSSDLTTPRDTPTSFQWPAAAIVTLVLAIVPAVLWPGAVSWMNDEPSLIINAFLANRGHHPADRGLFGSFLVPYGPLPTQVYQVLLLFTHDLRWIVIARAFLCSSILSLSLLWLARSLRLTPWFAAVVVLGPYIWWCQRVLWDATFMFPIGILAVAAYASFLRKGSLRSLTVAAVAAVLIPLVHPQALPLSIALAGHALWKHRPALRKIRLRLLAAGAIVFVLHAGYILWAVGCVVVHFTHLVMSSHFGNTTFLGSFSSPLLGGRLLTGIDFAHLHDLRGPVSLSRTVEFISLAGIPLVWLGIAVGLVRVFLAMTAPVPSPLYSGERVRVRGGSGESRSSTHRPSPQPSPLSTREREQEAGGGPRDSITAIALVALVLQMALAAFMRVPPWPQYCMGTFPIFVLLAWIGIDCLQRVRLGLPVLAIWGLSLAYITLAGAWQIHHFGWERGKMSPTLSNQIDIAKKLNGYTDRMVWTDVPMYQQYPHAMQALRMLNPPGPALLATLSAHDLLIRYKPTGDPRSSEIELIELDSNIHPPANATMFEVVPDFNLR